MAQPFLHASQHGSVVPGLDMDHPVGRKTRLFETGREQILLRDAPEHLSFRPRGDPGGEAGRGRAVHGAIAATGHLMQATERQPTTRQPAIQQRQAEGKDFARPQAIPFEIRDPLSKLCDGWTGGKVWHAEGATPGLCKSDSRCYVLYLFLSRQGVNPSPEDVIADAEAGIPG